VASAAEPRPLIDDTVEIRLPRVPRLPAVPDVGVTIEDLGRLPAPSASEGPAGDMGRVDGTGFLPEAGREGDGGPGLPGSIGLGADARPGGGARPGLWPSSRATRIAQKGHPAAHVPLIKGGLRWLREHQSDDGVWDCDGFALRCDPRLGHACDGPGAAPHDVGVTGLALLAFLGAGYDGSGQTPADEAVRKGLRWLRSRQDAEGCFGPRGDPRFTYAHACATIAMCEASTYNKSPHWRKCAQQAIAFVQACQTPYRGWRYGLRPPESDASVTGWMLLALKAGQDAGLEVSDRAIRDGLALLDALTDEATGRTGYLRPGDLPVRPDGFVDRWPAQESESLTAVAMCSRIFLGKQPDHPLTAGGARLLAAKTPRWDDRAGTIDMYYWYHGTLAMHQLGGPAWERWNAALEKVVVETQRKDGCAEGSWDPKDPWGTEGGRVYATAMMTLCLEVHWRYPLVFGARKEPLERR
jgi:hypothetical protein